MHDLYSTEPTQETCGRSYADYTAPTRQHELDHTDHTHHTDHTDHTDHVDHTDHTDHTDHLPEV